MLTSWDQTRLIQRERVHLDQLGTIWTKQDPVEPFATNLDKKGTNIEIGNAFGPIMTHFCQSGQIWPKRDHLDILGSIITNQEPFGWVGIQLDCSGPS